jgi:hypothetical protein
MDEEIKRGLIAGGIGGAIGGVVVVLAFLVRSLVGGPVKCPNCAEPMPTIRKPKNRRQALWGGWTCPKCGCELDRRGRRIEV